MLVRAAYRCWLADVRKRLRIMRGLGLASAAVLAHVARLGEIIVAFGIRWIGGTGNQFNFGRIFLGMGHGIELG